MMIHITYFILLFGFVESLITTSNPDNKLTVTNDVSVNGVSVTSLSDVVNANSLNITKNEIEITSLESSLNTLQGSVTSNFDEVVTLNDRISTLDTMIDQFQTTFAHTFDSINVTITNANELAYGNYTIKENTLGQVTDWTFLLEWTYYGKMEKHVIMTARTTVKCIDETYSRTTSLPDGLAAIAIDKLGVEPLTYMAAEVNFLDNERIQTLTITHSYTLKYGDVVRFYVSSSFESYSKVLLYHQPNFESYLSIASADFFEIPNFGVRFTGDYLPGTNIPHEPSTYVTATYTHELDTTDIVHVSANMLASCHIEENCDNTGVYQFLKKNGVVIMTDYRYIPFNSRFNIHKILSIDPGDVLSLEVSCYVISGSPDPVSVGKEGDVALEVSSIGSNTLRRIPFFEVDFFETDTSSNTQEITSSGVILQNYEKTILTDAYYILTAQSIFHNPSYITCEITMYFQINQNEDTGHVIKSMGPQQQYETIDTVILKKFSIGDTVRVMAKSSCESGIYEYKAPPVFASRFSDVNIPTSKL